jgi:helicase
VRDAYRLDDGVDVSTVRAQFDITVRAWLEGDAFRTIAERSGEQLDDVLGVHSSLLSYTVQVQVEQAVALLPTVRGG